MPLCIFMLLISYTQILDQCLNTTRSALFDAPTSCTTYRIHNALPGGGSYFVESYYVVANKIYQFTSSKNSLGMPNYLTITDGSNNVLTSGVSPINVAVGSSAPSVSAKL